MSICGKLVQYNRMSEPRPCLREKHNGGGHSPDLTGLYFGNLVVMSTAEPRVDFRTGKRRSQWIVSNNGFLRVVLANQLITGRCTGKRNRHGYSQTHRSEYDTVKNHITWITNVSDPNHHKYQGMPLFSDWNPKDGGSYEHGIKWIIENLGPKPAKNWSLDIIDHEKGFVPGNLRWAEHRTQRENQRYRKLGHCSIEEIEVEARRRGYKLIPFSD